MASSLKREDSKYLAEHAYWVDKQGTGTETERVKQVEFGAECQSEKSREQSVKDGKSNV